MNSKIVLITGATSGIGKATAIALAKQNFTVVIHGRNKGKTELVCKEIKELSKNSSVEYIVADLFSLEAVRKMAEEFKSRYNRLDVLINNAGGIMSKEREVTSEGFEKTIAINLLAPFLLTELLLNLLKESPNGRIVNVSSNSHKLNAKPNFQDLQLVKDYSPLRAYGNAKLFLIWISQHLAAKLKNENTNITINTLHPGAVATNFGVNSNLGGLLNFVAKLARPFFKTIEQGAVTLVYLASSEEVKNISGSYFENKKSANVADKYYTKEHEKQIWDYCETQTKSSVHA